MEKTVQQQIEEYENKIGGKLPIRFRNHLLLSDNLKYLRRDYDRAYFIKNNVYSIEYECLCEPSHTCDEDLCYDPRYKDDIFKAISEGVCTDKIFEDDDIHNPTTFTLTNEFVEKLENLGYYRNYFIFLCNLGCTDDFYLCVKGPRKGEIWYNAAGGDYFSNISDDKKFDYSKLIPDKNTKKN